MEETKYPYPPRLIGYSRVSTDDQDVRMQVQALKHAGVADGDIFSDKKSGKSLKRPGLQAALKVARPGDVIVVYRFDRLSRSLRDLLAVFEELHAKDIKLRSITEGLDTTTPMGMLMFQLAGMLAEFERRLISERTSHGAQAAKRVGVKFGPKPKVSSKQVDQAIKMLQSGAKVAAVAKRISVHPDTLRAAVLKANGGKRLWRVGPRAPLAERKRAGRVVKS